MTASDFINESDTSWLVACHSGRMSVFDWQAFTILYSTYS